MWKYILLLHAVNFGVVKSFISCDFEDGRLCDWSDVSNTEYDWTIQAGRTPDFTSGPENDHTFQNYLGHYIYANGGRASRTSLAVLRSKVINITKAVNLTFWYNMNGNGIGSAVLLREEVNSTSILWDKHGRQAITWQEALVSLDPGVFELVLQTNVSSPFGSDIAFDDIRLSSEPKTNRTIPTPSTTTTTTPAPSPTPRVVDCPVQDGGLFLPGTCDFETDKMCGYTTTKIQSLEWMKASGYRGSLFGTHITGDHTSGNGSYVFLHTDTGDKSTGKSVTLTSPTLSRQTRVCLQFAYLIVSQPETTLNVYSVTSDRRVQLASITDHEMKSWNVYNVSLCAENNTRIVFEGTKVTYLGYVALDDIRIFSGICEHEYTFRTIPTTSTTTHSTTVSTTTTTISTTSNGSTSSLSSGTPTIPSSTTSNKSSTIQPLSTLTPLASNGSSPTPTKPLSTNATSNGGMTTSTPLASNGSSSTPTKPPSTDATSSGGLLSSTPLASNVSSPTPTKSPSTNTSRSTIKPELTSPVTSKGGSSSPPPTPPSPSAAIKITTSGHVTSGHVTQHYPEGSTSASGEMSKDTRIIIIAVVTPSLLLIIVVVAVCVVKNKRGRVSEIPGSIQVAEVFVTQKSFSNTTNF